MATQTVPIHEAGELRFPDQNGPWSIRCHTVIDSSFKSDFDSSFKSDFDPTIYVALRSGSDRVSIQKVFSARAIHEWSVKSAAREFVVYLRDRGLEVHIDHDQLMDMITKARVSAVAMGISVIAKHYCEVVGSDTVANIWRTEEVQRILEE